MENSAVIESPGLPPATRQIDLVGVMKIPAVRQVGSLVGIAAAVAAGFAIYLWSQSPGYKQLYAQLEAAEAAQVVDALKAANIDYKLSDGGAILVPEENLHDARMLVAGQGIAENTGGMDLMQDQSSFGVSQFMENARYQHALEAELARTITSLGAVREARVHLALPKQSSFLRSEQTASASVVLQLGRASLEADQAQAIVNFVANSVPNLKRENVTVLDQFGRMLSAADDDWSDAITSKQFKYAERIEENYRRRIEELLTPLVGAGRVRAQVAARMDFTVTEETREVYDPATTALRSEQYTEEQKRGATNDPTGVPGALTNQPPEAGGIAAGEAADRNLLNSARSGTRNYEVDRTVSHRRPQVGTISRLSVAVLIDDRPLTLEQPAVETAGEEAAADGEAGAEADAADAAPVAAAVAAVAAFSDEDIARFTSLVKDAVGFDEQRGDTVSVVTAAFRGNALMPAVEEPPLWEHPLLRDLVKQLLGTILVLALAFGLVRPMLKNLFEDRSESEQELLAAGDDDEDGEKLLPANEAALAAEAAAAPPAISFDDKVTAARNLTGHDPARVAQLVKQWVEVDE